MEQHRPPHYTAGEVIMTDDQFWDMREEVLSQWPTGGAVDIDDAVQFHHSLPETKNCAQLYQTSKANGELKFMGYHSVGDLDAQIQNHRELAEENEWCATITDSHTRNLNFKTAEAAVKNGEPLNGLPIVTYGAQRCRRLINSIDDPEHVHCNGPDTRLSTEIGLASGFSGFTLSLGAFFYYTKNAPIEEVVRNQQYNLRLINLYHQRGVPVALDIVPIGKTTLVSHGLCLASNIIAALLAAEHGVKHLGLFTFPYGQVRADLAMLRQAIPLCERILKRAGHDDVEVYQHAIYTPGPYPESESRAYGGLSLFAAILGLADGAVQRVGNRTISEGIGIPTPSDYNETNRAYKIVLNTLADQGLALDDDQITREEKFLEAEVEAIVTKTLELGNGEIVTGIVNAVKRGILDCPFPSNANAANAVMVSRDAEGITRYWDPGHLPLPDDVVEYHEDRLAERERREGQPISVDLIAKDITAFREGQGLMVGD